MESEHPAEWLSRDPGTELAAQVSEAIAGRIGSWLSAETEAEIRDRYGPEIAAWVRLVYDSALNCPVDWRTATMDSALDAMHDFLDKQFPWLSQPARTKLNYCFIMAWK